MIKVISISSITILLLTLLSYLLLTNRNLFTVDITVVKSTTVTSTAKISSINKKTVKFLHITDIHYNKYYSNCTREKKSCDTPLSLLNKTMNAISNFKFDFVIVTGDTARHSSDEIPQTLTEIKCENLLVFEKVKKFRNLVVSIGNNDVLDIENISSKEYENFANVWNLSDFKEGYYFKQFDEISVISVNSLLFYRQCTEQSKKHLNWISKQLKGKKNIFLVSHIPPYYYQKECYDLFLKVLRRKNVVMFTGHANLDFGNVYSFLKNNGLRLFSAPSIEPQLNPGFRLFEMEVVGELLGYKQYYLDYSSDTSEFKVLYDTYIDYGLENLSLQTMKKFYKKLLFDDELFLKFAKNSFVFDKKWINRINHSDYFKRRPRFVKRNKWVRLAYLVCDSFKGEGLYGKCLKRFKVKSEN